MDQDKVEYILGKLLPNILPDPVKDVAFDVRHSAPNEFTLHAVFYVPDKWWTSMDDINRAAFSHQVKMKLRSKIKDYTGINVVFDKTNTRVLGDSNWNN
jgi:hypothetical protein